MMRFLKICWRITAAALDSPDAITLKGCDDSTAGSKKELYSAGFSHDGVEKRLLLAGICREITSIFQKVT
jgi:hypothetical protein